MLQRASYSHVWTQIKADVTGKQIDVPLSDTAIGFCPIGSPNRPDRDTTPEDVADIQAPELVTVAKKHGVHPAVICLK